MGLARWQEPGKLAEIFATLHYICNRHKKLSKRCEPAKQEVRTGSKRLFSKKFRFSSQTMFIMWLFFVNEQTEERLNSIGNCNKC